MIIALFTNIAKSHARPLALGIREFLEARGVVVVGEDGTAGEIGLKPLAEADWQKIDFAISLGGDGTILRLYHKHPDLNVPVLGINLGGLGFMADVTLEEVYPCLDNLLSGRYRIDSRLMMRGETLQQQTSFAINDIVIHRAQNPSLIDLAINVDGNYLNTFSADGIILATPNGSTAYSLSAGGPILTPELDAIVITPICPHTISNRPIVLMPKKEIEVRNLSDCESIEIVYDGYTRHQLHSGEMVRIVIDERRFRMVNMPNHDYFATLRSKLNWTGTLLKK